MKQGFISVPFKSDGSGIKEYNGIAKFSDAGIVFEFESKYFGLIGSEVKEVRIALEEILDLKFRRGFFRTFATIQLRLRNFTKVSELPHDGGKVKLKIRREDFDFAEQAVARTLELMSGAAEQISGPADEQPEQLPPPATSVNELFDTEKLGKKDPKATKKLKDE